MNPILDFQSQTASLRAEAPQRATAYPPGSIGGIPVTPEDGRSVLAEAAEEVGLHLSARIEQRLHADRATAAARPPRVIRLERINEYFEKSRQTPGRGDLASLVRDLLKGEGVGSFMSSGARGLGPTERYMLLQYALEVGRSGELSGDLIAQTEDALADLEMHADMLIRADLATIDQAVAYGESARDIAKFQASLHAILGKPDLGQAFQEAVVLAGGKGSRLEVAVTQLMEALGACLAACSAASEKVRLETLVGELYHLKCINTLFHDARSVIRTLRRQHPGRPRQGAPGDEDRS